MAAKKKAPRDDPEQSKRFIEMAREIEVDEAPEAFRRAFEKVVTTKAPETRPKPGKR